MNRPREPLADALRTARAIVLEQGSVLALAARGADEAQIEEAGAALAARIADAIVEAEREVLQHAAEAMGPDALQLDLYLRAIMRP